MNDIEDTNEQIQQFQNDIELVRTTYQQLSDWIGSMGREIVQALKPTIETLCRILSLPFPCARQSPQTKHYLAVKRKQHKRAFTPRLSCQRSSRRLAVLAKRKRLGMDIHGRHWAYQGWKRREILEIAVCIGGFPE